MLKKYLKKTIAPKASRFFMPGHKGRLCGYDVTETYGTDDLRAPRGILKQAQEKAAQAFGVDSTFFLVNGATAGIQAMLAASCKRGDKIIINYGCHVSVLNAVELLGLIPIIATPTYNTEFSIYGEIAPENITEALATHPDSRAIFITSPNYYGICSDVLKIAEIVHKNNIPLLVDQAHGAHFKFNARLPIDAMECGADLCVQSAHKTLPCLTQCAYLHCRGDIIKKNQVQNALNIFQTTSPSYIFLSALDEAYEIMSRTGKQKLDWLIDECNSIRQTLEKNTKIKCLSGENIDPTRLIFNFENTTETAKDITEKLRKNKVYIEMQEGDNIICIPSIYNRPKDFKRLAKILKETR